MTTKFYLTLIAASGIFVSNALSQNKPFFSSNYPSNGVLESRTDLGATQQPLAAPGPKDSRITSTDDPRVKDGRITSTDDNLPMAQEPERQMAHPANLSQWGADFDKAHPGFYNEPDKAAIQKDIDDAGAPPMPASASAVPSREFTPDTDHSLDSFFASPSVRSSPKYTINQAEQPEAHPTGTPVPPHGSIALGAVQPEAHPTGPTPPPTGPAKLSAVQPAAHPTGPPLPLTGSAKLSAVQPEAHPTESTAPLTGSARLSAVQPD